MTAAAAAAAAADRTGSGPAGPAVVVSGWIDWDPAQRDQVLEHFGEVAVASRAEPDCVDYWVAPDLLEPARIRVFEHWTSEQALRAHLALPHVQQFRAAVATLARTGRSLQLHVLASSGPMTS